MTVPISASRLCRRDAQGDGGCPVQHEADIGGLGDRAVVALGALAGHAEHRVHHGDLRGRTAEPLGRTRLGDRPPDRPAHRGQHQRSAGGFVQGGFGHRLPLVDRQGETLARAAARGDGRYPVLDQTADQAAEGLQIDRSLRVVARERGGRVGDRAGQTCLQCCAIHRHGKRATSRRATQHARAGADLHPARRAALRCAEGVIRFAGIRDSSRQAPERSSPRAPWQ